MAGQKIHEMFRHTNRSDTRAATTVRNAKRLMQIQMTNIRPDSPRRTNDPAEAERVAKAQSVYFCSACGFESPRWLGRCPQCQAWNSFDERPFAVAPRGARAKPTAAQSAAPVPLREIGSGGVLADDMGLGKTVQALALLLLAACQPRLIGERLPQEECIVALG